MSIRYGFFDNQLIGVDELKDITKGIQSNGISINQNQMAVSDLNQFYEKIFTTGVVPETDTSLKVSVSGTTITVAPGTAYFENGTFITVIEAETLTKISGAVNYVYAVSDRDKRKAYIEIFAGTKENDVNGGIYYVPLAEIATDGTITDKRVYATSTLAAVPPANASGNYINTITLPDTDEGTLYTMRINANPSQYKYLQLLSYSAYKDNSWSEISIYERCTFLQFDISDYKNKIPSICIGARYSHNGQDAKYSENILTDNRTDLCWICGTDYQQIYVTIQSVDESGITLGFCGYTTSSNDVCGGKFELALIRKESITDETTVTIE